VGSAEPLSTRALIPAKASPWGEILSSKIGLFQLLAGLDATLSLPCRTALGDDGNLHIASQLHDALEEVAAEDLSGLPSVSPFIQHAERFPDPTGMAEKDFQPASLLVLLLGLNLGKQWIRVRLTHSRLGHGIYASNPNYDGVEQKQKGQAGLREMGA